MDRPSSDFCSVAFVTVDGNRRILTVRSTARISIREIQIAPEFIFHNVINAKTTL